MKGLWLALLVLPLVGCVGPDVAKTIQAMEQSDRAKCGVITTPMYGTMAIGVAGTNGGTNVSASPNGCFIEDADTTTVRVPRGAIQVTPPNP